ncbi:MAG: amidohydrolase [Balneolaceae bacterium]
MIVLKDINGYTFQGRELTQFEAIAIQGGKVLEIGTSTGIQAAYPNAKHISGEGNTVLPGLIDAHAHILDLGYQKMGVQIAGNPSLEGTVERVREFAGSHPGQNWIRGSGWNQVLWERNEFPTAADLDRGVADRPVWLERVDGHAGWANSRAMELAGVDSKTPDPNAGGRIVRNEKGEPAGIFIDGAMDLISSAVPDRTLREKEQALVQALKIMNEYGLTGVHAAGIGKEEWNLYATFAEQGKLTVRIYAMMDGTGEFFDQMSESGPIENYGNGENRLALRSVKIWADGALGSRGAALLEDYQDDSGNKGLLFYDQEELNQMVCKGVSNGYQMNIHAIGDAANRQVLNSFEKALKQCGGKELRHRIEHAQVVHLNDILRFRELDIIASMQPVHATSDMNMAEDRIGPDRMEGAYAWQKFLRQGTVIAAGSDFPVESANPFEGLYSAVTRQDPDGQPTGGGYPEESMSREEALRAFTTDAAYAAHQEEVLGTLEPGKWADFIIIDRDYFKVPVREIREISVLETWVGGQRIKH